MNALSFFFGLLCLISLDSILGFLIFIFYKYFDLKYFSNLEINQLKEENKKVNGSVNFWDGV